MWQKSKLENGDLEKGDSILITGPTTGVIRIYCWEIRVDLKETVKALKGELCSIKTPHYLDALTKFTSGGRLRNRHEKNNCPSDF